MRRWLARIAALLAALLAFFVLGWVPWFLGGVATTRRFAFPDKENAGFTPASFELPFEDVKFRSRDGVDLSGWWVGAEQPRGTVVLVHGLNRSRIEMVKKLPFLHAEGWNALLIDLRHHGDSGGEVSSFGYFEKEDVLSAAAWARERSPVPIVAWGVSLGGATATLAAAADPGIAGLVCDSSYRSLRDTVKHHMGLARSWRWWMRIVPPWPVADAVIYWIGRRGGFDPEAVDVLGAAARLAGRPALFVANSGDRRMPSDIAFDLQRAVGDTAHVLIVPGDSHGGAYREGQAAYEHEVQRVLFAVAPPPAAIGESAVAAP